MSEGKRAASQGPVGPLQPHHMRETPVAAREKSRWLVAAVSGQRVLPESGTGCYLTAASSRRSTRLVAVEVRDLEQLQRQVVEQRRAHRLGWGVGGDGHCADQQWLGLA